VLVDRCAQGATVKLVMSQTGHLTNVTMLRRSQC
jgi:hypothetical protein